MADENKKYTCPQESCTCEITINKLPNDYGTFGSMNYGEATYGGGPEPKCPFCQSEMREVS